MDWSKSRLKIVLNIVYETRRARKPRDKNNEGTQKNRSVHISVV